jgi:hypothetical protein
MYKEFSRERKPEGGKLQRRNIQINICINNNNNNNNNNYGIKTKQIPFNHWTDLLKLYYNRLNRKETDKMN